MRSEGSAREKVLETSDFFGGEGSGSEIGESQMTMASQSIQQQAWMWSACRVFFLPRKRHLRTVAFFSHRIQHEEERRYGCHSEPLFSGRGFSCVGHTCAVIKTSLCKRVETQTCDVGDSNTQHVERRWFFV